MSEQLCLPLILKQSLVTVGASLSSMNNGLMGGLTSIVISQLLETKYIELDTDKISWYASIIGIMSICGLLIGSFTMNYFGRKKTFFIGIALNITGWICTYSASSYGWLLFGRMLCGTGMGVNVMPTSIYIGECTTPKYRGCMLASITFFLFSGILLSHVIGTTFGWQKTALSGIIIGSIQVAILLYTPESPSILAVHGKYDECKAAFRWLRGSEEEDELEELIKNVKDKAEASKQEQNNKFTERIKKKITIMKRKDFYKPVLIMQVFFILSEWCGSTLMDHYTIDIVKTVVGDGPHIGPIIYSIDLQRIITTFFAIFVFRLVTRRLMLITLVSLNVLIYFGIAGYTYAKSHAMLAWDHPYIGALLLHIHMFAISMGTVPLPNIIYGEIFPLEFRHISSMLTFVVFSVSYFVNMKIVPYLFSSVQLYGTYCIFGTVVLICLIVLWMYLPETKDRTLQEIEDEFNCTKKVLDTKKTSIQVYDLIIDHENKMIEMENRETSCAIK